MKARVFGTADRRLAADVRRLARLVGSRFGMADRVVNVVFVSDRAMRRLNRRFRHRDRPTDVLSFEMPPPADVRGEVYVSRDRARIQACRFKVRRAEELRRLVLHGLLHLAGLTHRQMPARLRDFPLFARH